MFIKQNRMLFWPKGTPFLDGLRKAQFDWIQLSDQEKKVQLI